MNINKYFNHSRLYKLNFYKFSHYYEMNQAIKVSAISPLSALGSLTRLLGVDDRTADNLAIGGALIGTVVGSGIAPKYGVMNDTPLGKNEVVVPNKVGVNNTNTNNGINSGKNVYVTLDAN